MTTVGVARSEDALGVSTAPVDQDELRRVDQPSATPAAAATRRVLLGHVSTEGAASAVATRIRTAIGLGVLADGEKLPREADLAQQLGVTAFSLREALSTLRREGLIVTRVGKNGGSYVAHPPPGESLAGEELVRLSATELRDLGDWKAALTTYAAWLAARRGSESTADRLISCVEDLVSAADSAAARRSLGRFHVELAAGAQSQRLTRAELAVHEEFDWLAQVPLQQQRHLEAVAEAMRAVSTHVRAGDAEAAWHAGERLVCYVSTELIRTRLQMIAARHAAAWPAVRAAEGDLAAELRLLSDRTVRLLEDMAQDVCGAFDRQPTAQTLYAEVARGVLPRLPVLDDVVHGLGFMAEVGVLPDARYWVEWWQRTADGTFDRDYSHQLDPARDDFYDYSAKSYMTTARGTDRPSASGPYIDHGGVDDHVVTLSVPVRSKGSFVGILAADIRMASLERAVSPWLAQADGTCVVLNSEGRVLLSNSVRHDVGDVAADPGLSLTDVGCFGWVVGRA